MRNGKQSNTKQSNTKQSAAKNGQNIRTGGNADRDAKENRKAADQPMSKKVPEERKVKIHRRKNRKSKRTNFSRAGL